MNQNGAGTKAGKGEVLVLRKSNRNRVVLAAGTSVSLCLVMMPAQAQNVPPASADTAPQQTPSQGRVVPGSKSAAGTKTTVPEEVTVSARRRKERLVDVPVAVTQLGRKDVEKYAATSLADIANTVPGVSFERTQSGASGASFTIRGVGDLALDYSNEQPVAINIDGIQITRGHVADIGTFDLSSVTILKGPQSLFYGKNSPAGVVSLDSPVPGKTLEGYVRTSYEFNTRTPAIEAAVSIPLTDTLSIRLAGRFDDMLGGYIENTARPIADPFDPGHLSLPGAAYREGPGTERAIGRFTMAWKPSDDFDATARYLASSYSDQGGAVGEEVFTCGSASKVNTQNLLNPAQVVVDPFSECSPNHKISDGSPPSSILRHFYNAPDDGKPFSDTKLQLASLIMNYRIPGVTFTSVTGYFHQNQGAFDNFDGTVFAQALDAQEDRDTLITQELRAATKFDIPVNFTVGAYFEHDNHNVGDTDKIFPLGPYPGPGPFHGVTNTIGTFAHDFSQNYSIFAEGHWKILPNLELAGGARWSHDDRHSSLGNQFNFLDAFDTPVTNPFSPGGFTYKPKVSESYVTPEATLSYHPIANTTLYAAYKTGYLAGGIANPANISNYTQLADSSASLVFGKETVQGGEIGAKGALFNGRLRGDVTLYDYKYTGLQVQTLNPTTLAYTINSAGGASDKGFELQTSFQVTDTLQVHGSLELTELFFDSYKNAQCYPTQTAAQGCINGSQDLSGTRYGSAPASFNLGLNYRVDLPSEFHVDTSADAFYNAASPRYEADPIAFTKSYTLVDVSARLTKDGQPWDVALIGSNITSAIYYKNYLFKPLGTGNAVIAESLSPPPEVTLQLTYRF